MSDQVAAKEKKKKKKKVRQLAKDEGRRESERALGAHYREFF